MKWFTTETVREEKIAINLDKITYVKEEDEESLEVGFSADKIYILMEFKEFREMLCKIKAREDEKNEKLEQIEGNKC